MNLSGYLFNKVLFILSLFDNLFQHSFIRSQIFVFHRLIDLLCVFEYFYFNLNSRLLLLIDRFLSGILSIFIILILNDSDKVVEPEPVTGVAGVWLNIMFFGLIGYLFFYELFCGVI